MVKPKVVAAPPAANKPKFCTSKIREIAEVKVCNFKLRKHSDFGDYCENKDNHLNPFPTGYCSSGWHEGTKAVTASGKAAPTCKFYINCPCDCHARLNRMFEISGQPRTPVDISEWKPEFKVSLLPAVSPVVAPSIEEPTDVPDAPEEPPTPALPAPITRSFAPTTTGRTARGELESWVKVETDAWAADVIASKLHPEIRVVHCTPLFIAREIARSQGIKQPSDGAVHAVLMRWENLGFAKVERGPIRFAGYTDEGLKLGLDAMKARAKRKAATNR